MSSYRLTVMLVSVFALVALPLSAETLPTGKGDISWEQMFLDEGLGDGLLHVADHPTIVSSGSTGQADGGGFESAGSPAPKLGSFSININPGATLAANPAALAAFYRAANQWEARIADPIGVNIDADLADLGGGGVIGQSNTVVLQGPYYLFRDPMVADSAGEADDGIVASLPTAAQFSAYVPPNVIGIPGASAAKANLKALGIAGLDTQFGPLDGTITFNTQFDFDFDNSDGVDAGKMDFETVAAHELGHALGFLSRVDYIDWLMDNGFADEIYPTTLDMFRFLNDEAGMDPETPAEFTTFGRFMWPGYDPITDTLDTDWGTLGFVGDPGEFFMSTGTTQGDGRQASHWKDDMLSGSLIGAMDPTLGLGTIQPIDEPDFRALDLIGYEIDPIPEPSTLVMLMGLAATCLFVFRRRK